MKKNSLIIMALLIAFIIFLAVLGVYGYNQYKENKEIQIMNKGQFGFLKCISTCPIVHGENKTAIKQVCMANCTNENINNTIKEFQIKYPLKQLIKDYDYMSCTSKIDLRDAMTLEKYQSCLIKVIPVLQRKYDYLK